MVQNVADNYNKNYSQRILFIDNQLNIFYLAHSTVLKGLHILLSAFRELIKNKIRVKLFIGGGIQKSYKKYLNKNFNDLYADVAFLGPIDNTIKDIYFKKSDIFVCPSIIDMSPVTVFEAMLNKLPVIVTENCGNKWIINNYCNGFIVQSSNTDELVEKLNWCSMNKDKLIQMGENAYDTYQRYLSNNGDEIKKIISYLKR